MHRCRSCTLSFLAEESAGRGGCFKSLRWNFLHSNENSIFINTVTVNSRYLKVEVHSKQLIIKGNFSCPGQFTFRFSSLRHKELK